MAAAEHDPAALFRLCCRLLAAGDPRANDLLPELERFPAFAPGWVALGRTLAERHPAGALAAFARAMPSAEAALGRASVLRRGGDLRAARESAEQAASLDPSSGDAWHALGVILQDLDDHAAAAAAFRAALAARPGWHESAFNLGVALQETGEQDAALDAYAAAWRAKPDSFGRIAQALASPRAGRLWLDPAALRRELAARV